MVLAEDHPKITAPAIGGESDTYFDRDPKGMTGGRVSDCICSSASQMGQDQISFKVPCSLEHSGCSTRLCEVHLAVGKPLRPMPWSSSIIFELAPGFEVLYLYPRIAIGRPTLTKRKLERSFFQASGAALPNYLKDNLGIKQDIAATTDSSGYFSVELPPGFYDVFVTAIAFTPRCNKVRLKGQEARTYDVKLKVSPVTSKELD